MSYTVSASDLTDIRFSESDPVRSVLQNVAVILSTQRGSVPMYRDFGIDMNFLDRPMPVAKVMMRSVVREAVEKWEPRATVVGVTFVEDLSDPGRLIPTVEVEIDEQQEP